ncbi:MAG: RnfABCDGE type electron transport complex subunit D [Vicinamibacterales bacterium]
MTRVRHPLPAGAALRKFFRTPKGLMTAVLVLLAAVAAPVEGVARVLPGLLSAIAVAMAIDAPILRLRGGTWAFPSGALLTALFVAMLLSPHEPWWVTATTAAVGVLSKYAFRTRTANVFNPAALAIIATFYVFDTGQSWWGALGDMAPWLTLVLITTGVFITDRVNKMPLVLAFLGAYYLCFTVTAFVGSPTHVAEIFRAPDLQMALFFAFFILTDPPTSPVRYRDQVVCGVLVALTSYAVFQWIGAAYYLLAGVLVGNVWEAWRRVRAHAARSRHSRPRPVHPGPKTVQPLPG